MKMWEGNEEGDKRLRRHYLGKENGKNRINWEKSYAHCEDLKTNQELIHASTKETLRKSEQKL